MTPIYCHPGGFVDTCPLCRRARSDPAFHARAAALPPPAWEAAAAARPSATLPVCPLFGDRLPGPCGAALHRCGLDGAKVTRFGGCLDAVRTCQTCTLRPDLSPTAWQRIPGWFTPEEAAAYRAVLAPFRNAAVVEVGTYRGRSAAAAGEVLAGTGCVLHCVDPCPDDAVWEDAGRNLAPFGAAVEMHRTTSAAAAAGWSGGPVGCVFIDGDHSYASVRADIDAWLPHVSPGGVVCGHDYSPGHPDIVRAVEETFPFRGLAGSFWWAAVPPAAPPAAFLINLDRRPDRMAAAAAELGRAGVPFTRWPAVDGSRLAPADYPGGPGAYGCLESHRRLLERCVAGAAPAVLVFEDDVTLCADFAARLRSVVAALPTDWDAVLLGGEHVSRPTPVSPGVVRCGGPKGTHRTHAYLARGPYLRTLYGLWTEGHGHCDHLWGRRQHEARVYAPAEWLCGQRAGASDISGRPDAERWWPAR